MDNKRFNLASHWEELGESCQKICLRELPFKDIMEIIKGWNPTRKRTAEPDRAYSDSFRLTGCIPAQFSCGFTPFRHQQISVQESPFFTIPGSFQENTMIQGQEKDIFQAKSKRVRPNDPEAVGLGEEITQEPEIVVNTSRISSLNNRNITPTQNEHSVFTPEGNLNNDIANTLQNVRKRKNIGKYSQFRRSGFKEKQNFRLYSKDKPKEKVAEVTKNRNTCHNFGSTDHYANSCPKAKKKVYAIEKFPEEEFPTEDSESYSMGDAISKQYDDDQYAREEFLVEHQEETQIEIQDIQLEAGMPQDTSNENLCKPTKDAQIFLVTTTKGMAYIHGTATKVTVCIDNSQYLLITDSGAHCSIVAKNYLNNHFSNWEKKLLPTKGKKFESASGKVTSIGTIIKEIIITHRKGNIRLNISFVVLDDAHIQGFLLGTDYQRIFGIDI
ncbi:hypothetical protein O181_012784 [Austropuccinia psidii MF-1]|uniref:Uncharacterized protein n=1 Tax=Austropuccinia psidii MF-1 TaxID=1389203 RepID=A0A9Q3BV79_9BASI|nr:hypothetical protein [Austropuccinia psidii MF-1]